MTDKILSSFHQIALEDEVILEDINNLENFPNDHEGWVRLGNKLQTPML